MVHIYQLYKEMQGLPLALHFSFRYIKVYYFIFSKNIMIRKIINTVLVVLVYVFSYLATATDVLGPQPTNLSGVFPFTFMPPGIVFMFTWTTIFVLLGIFTIYMRKKYKDEAKNSLFLDLFAWTSILNIAWLISTAQEAYTISFIIMVLLFLTLGKMLDILLVKGRNSYKNRGWITFGAYYGRVSVATWALWLSQVLYTYNPTFTMSQTWSWIAIALGAGVTLLSRLRWKNLVALLFSFFGLWGALWAKFLGR